ncbi:MAG: efflux RND transporter periplasmic adaptor subunit [Paenibacillaceae bacterium]
MKGFLRRKIVFISILVIIIAGVGSYLLFFNSNKTLVKSTTENIVTVTKGNLRASVSGTSQFEAKMMQTISIPSDGTMKSMNLTRNKSVKNGEVLFEINNPDYNISLQKAQLALTQLQKDYDDLNKQFDSLAIIAPLSGKLTLANNVDIASQVSKTSKIATISDMSTLTVTLPFLLEDASQFKVNDPVDIAIEGFMLTKMATIKAIAKKPHADAAGNKILDVDIEVSNDHTLDAGLIVQGSITVNGYTSESQGKAALQYSKTVTLISNAGGNIKALNYKNGDLIEQGDVLGTITNDTLQNDISIKQATIDQQQVTIADLQEKVDSLIVKAPFDGLFSTDFVNQKTNTLSSFQVGAKVTLGGQLGGVASLDSMQLPIQVDELDLPSIKDNMTAEVKVDSLAGRIYKGEVNQISTVGTTTNGVTFYTVVLSVANANQTLKYGMTATAEILIQNKENVLVLPIETMQSQQGKRYVSLKKADGTTELKHEIKIGIRTKTQVEILEGLKEGDKVVTPVLQRQAQTLSTADIAALRKQFEQNGGPAGFGGSGGAGGFGGGGNGGNGGNGGTARTGGGRN